MAYRILTLEEALNEGKERALPMPIYNDSIDSARAKFIWMVKIMYDNGMAVAVLDKNSVHYPKIVDGYNEYINDMAEARKEKIKRIKSTGGITQELSNTHTPYTDHAPPKSLKIIRKTNRRFLKG